MIRRRQKIAGSTYTCIPKSMITKLEKDFPKFKKFEIEMINTEIKIRPKL
jgi:hypothetical protein